MINSRSSNTAISPFILIHLLYEFIRSSFILQEYEKNESDELEAEEGAAEENEEVEEEDEFDKEYYGEENEKRESDGIVEDSSNANPLEFYMREEMYPGLSEDVIEKLHYPERGLPEDALVDDLPLFPNPFDHSQDEDNETDPEKIRKEDYDFNGANVIIETRDYVMPHTWEDEKLGEPHENRIVRLRVRVRELGLPIIAAQKLVLMAGPRYNFNNDILTLTSDRYFTRKQNGRYLMDLLENLINEAKKETVINESPKRLPSKRGRFLPFNKDMLGSGAVKKQYEGMITEDEQLLYGHVFVDKQ